MNCSNQISQKLTDHESKKDMIAHLIRSNADKPPLRLSSGRIKEINDKLKMS